MSFARNINVKKNALLVYKEKLLKDLAFCDRRLEELRQDNNKPSYDVYDSSDDDTDLLAYMPDMSSQDLSRLKLEKDNLKICLEGTQDLTGLTMLDSEVKILGEDPVFEDPVIKESLEPGIWKEVVAECRLDLVPFTITFLLHQPYRKDGCPSFHNLRVAPEKQRQEIELSKSVLDTVATPSEAVEVIKNYSEACRSRRTTLAKLVEAFSATLFMEELTEGGYKLKCADVVEICWRVENAASAVAPFQHRFKFDLDYLDPSYLGQIKDAYKQLSNPVLTTDERTLLLAEIIKICLEARPDDENESTAEVHQASEVQKSTKVDNAKKTKSSNENKSPDNQGQNSEEVIKNTGKSKTNNENILERNNFKDNEGANSNVVDKGQRSKEAQKKQKTAKVREKLTEVNNVQNEGSDINKKKVTEDNGQKSKDNNVIKEKVSHDQEKNITEDLDAVIMSLPIENSKQTSSMKDKARDSQREVLKRKSDDQINLKETNKTKEVDKQSELTTPVDGEEHNIIEAQKDSTNTNIVDKNKNAAKNSKKIIHKNKAINVQKENLKRKSDKTNKQSEIKKIKKVDKVKKNKGKENINKDKPNSTKAKKVETAPKSQSENLIQNDLVSQLVDNVAANTNATLTIGQSEVLKHAERDKDSNNINNQPDNEPTKSVKNNLPIKQISKISGNTAQHIPKTHAIVNKAKDTISTNGQLLRKGTTEKSITNIPLTLNKGGNIKMQSAGNTVKHGGLSKIPKRKMCPAFKNNIRKSMEK